MSGFLWPAHCVENEHDVMRRMRAVLLKCADFVEAECEQRASSGGSMTDYVGEAENLLSEIEAVLEEYK